MGLVALFFVSFTLTQVISDKPHFVSANKEMKDDEMDILEQKANPTQANELEGSFLKIKEVERADKFERKV